MKQCLMCNAIINDQLSLAQILQCRQLTEKAICDNCACRFEYLKPPFCDGCGKPQTQAKLCTDCEAWQIKTGYLLHNRSLLSYNEATKEFMQQYKFNGDFRLRHVFARSLTKIINDLQGDVIIPIPINEYTWKTRGFNQVTGMLDVSHYESLLISKNKAQHTPQSHKKRYERLLTRQPFRLDDKSLNKIKHKKIILVDDVYTTGRTLYHAADLVQTCHPSQLVSVTLAR